MTRLRTSIYLIYLCLLPDRVWALLCYVNKARPFVTNFKRFPTIGLIISTVKTIVFCSKVAIKRKVARLVVRTTLTQPSHTFSTHSWQYHRDHRGKMPHGFPLHSHWVQFLFGTAAFHTSSHTATCTHVLLTKKQHRHNYRQQRHLILVAKRKFSSFYLPLLAKANNSNFVYLHPVTYVSYSLVRPSCMCSASNIGEISFLARPNSIDEQRTVSKKKRRIEKRRCWKPRRGFTSVVFFFLYESLWSCCYCCIYFHSSRQRQIEQYHNKEKPNALPRFPTPTAPPALRILYREVRVCVSQNE